MSVSGKILYQKIEHLRSDLSTSITSDIFDKICDNPTVQPFLEWFCNNVTRANVLSKEELHLKNKLENTEEWLRGKELDEALEELTRNNPELLELIDFEDENVDEKLAELESLKDLHKMDEDYEKLLKNNILKLKELEYSLEDEIEQEENNYEKEEIELLKAFNDCNVVLEKLDEENRSLSKETEQLLTVYTDAIENKGQPILWIQMPIDLFIKQIKLYNDYLDILIKRQFSLDNQEVEHEQKEDNMDYDSFMNDSKEHKMNKQTQELSACKLKLTNSKLGEVYMKMREGSSRAMLERAQLMWNDGNLNLPEETHILDEVMDLTRKRDFLEESIILLRERQLPEVIEQYAKAETIRVLQQTLLVRLRNRQTRFNKLKSLLSLTREHGHLYSDLLAILMDIQFHSLKEISEIIVNIRHYLTTEYSLSSSRCDIMRQQQEEYAVLQASVINQNIFNELFISMMSINDVSSDTLKLALAKYNDLIASNKEMKQFIFDSFINDKINKILLLEKEVSSNYDKERNIGITKSFVPISYKLNVQYQKTLDQYENVKTNLTTMRNVLKEKMRNNNRLEQEKDILWQRFLTDPETLRNHYEENKRIADRLHFGRDTG